MTTHDYIIEFSATMPLGKVRRFRDHVAVVITTANAGQHALEQVIKHCALVVKCETGCVVRAEDIQLHVMAPVPPVAIP